MGQYRVRFAKGSKYQAELDSQCSTSMCHNSPASTSPPESNCPISSKSITPKPHHTKSRFGCKQCRLRRVKCDETFPVCLRCQRRGSVCLASYKPAKWHTEMPWLSDMIVLDSWPRDSALDKRLVQHWVEQTSQLWSIDRNNNPLSLPVLQHLTTSPSLLHAIQSVSAGHENYFNNSGLQTCLEERGRALKLVREELRDATSIPVSSMLTIFLLGTSSPWIQSDSWGKEHLDGARALIKVMLSRKGIREESLTQFLLGWYLYWDMTCSFLDDPENNSHLSTSDILQSVQLDGDLFHPIIGFSSTLYAQVADVGRYCRRILEQQPQDPEFEETMEEQLVQWCPRDDDKCLHDLSLAYRNHGLLMLYQTCHRLPDPMRLIIDPCDDDGSEGLIVGTENVVRSYALEIIRMVLEIPLNEPCANFQSMPLLSAAAELTSEDSALREDVIVQFKALYSTDRVLVHLQSIDLLQELWNLRDCGVVMSWMELSLANGFGKIDLPEMER
ncbi:unnamed protein product [Clonostachys chloroleuca]|uniref:Zn(2)-C6 fungal-type domain-containing protein n=1 Tax=Clonostachys chloroleuca TaxID=1926264 RepID=A0AA35LRJ0_9HYPO|nr:unnamed protein product [Clonostachys chloroleuca]